MKAEGLHSDPVSLYTALLHYPVYNKCGETIASAVTVMDLHDIARAARTYGVKRFFVVTPLEDQRQLAERVVRHWTEGFGARYNSDRKEAMELLCLAGSLEEMVQEVTGLEGRRPLLMATDAARQDHNPISFEEARGLLRRGDTVVVLFGTAWGLTRDVILKADYNLEPILGKGTYNHLSVRSAASIILDRLVSGWI